MATRSVTHASSIPLPPVYLSWHVADAAASSDNGWFPWFHKVRGRIVLMQFWKYHAAGNDYLVVDDCALARDWSDAQIQLICDRHRGIGGDGILIAQFMDATGPSVRIYNPDGSEAEKSGNGLRILARFLWDQQRVGQEPFRVHTRGGDVTCQVLETGDQVRVEMGQASFESRAIPVAGPDREVLLESIDLQATPVTYSAVTIGNPHCVVLRNEVSEADARQWGPLLERATRFPRRTNVQFVQVVDDRSLRIEIWERGAGYTLSSGSSSCAAAAVAHRLARVGRHVEVHMPGGTLLVDISDDYHVTLTGPVVRIGCFDADDTWLLNGAR